MNTNCLKDMMCPKCGQTERFHIDVFASATLTDDGVDEYEGADFDDNHTAGCALCDWSGTVAELHVPTISVTFEIYTDLGLEMGEPDRRGWWLPGEWLHDEYPGEDAFVFDPDDFDEDEHDDLAEAIVDWAVGVLEREGATHPSDHPANNARWWSTEGNEVLDYETGARIGKCFHFNYLPGELIERINFRMMEG